jgi:hypothetical protein
MMNSATQFTAPDSSKGPWIDRVKSVYGKSIPDASGADIWTRVDRLAQNIAQLDPLPDIISINETEGWRWCFVPGSNVGDYDVYDRLIAALSAATGRTYRLSHMVGIEGHISTRCTYYSGDAVLYNSALLLNRNPDDVAQFGASQQPHDSTHTGTVFKRSLPICNPGSARMPLMASLIDGPSQNDKCGRPLPSGPVLTLQVQPNPADDVFMTASVVRFSFLRDTRFSFDFITTHPHNGDVAAIAPILANFLVSIQSPPLRKLPRYYPALLVGDFNTQADDIPNFTSVSGPVGDDFMGIRSSSPQAFPSYFTYRVTTKTVVPMDPTQPFSDHVALVAHLEWVDPPM